MTGADSCSLCLGGDAVSSSPDQTFRPRLPHRSGGPRWGGSRRRNRLVALAGVALMSLVAVVAMTGSPQHVSDQDAVSVHHGPPTQPPGSVPAVAVPLARCPWLAAAVHRHEAPGVLARLVVGRMTLAEKLGEIVLLESPPYENFNAGDPRLCIPSLVLQDGPQGVAFGASHVTQLPAPLAIGATFDPSIARTYGRVIGTEASEKGINVIQGPNLNIVRVPESGRNFESFGEDPMLVSAMGVAGIEGIQSAGVMAMAKHFVAYSQETDRGELNDTVQARTLEEVYFPPFEAAVTQAHVSAVLCAYPELNGTLQCQDPKLLGQLRRWGFTGFVRSDLGSVNDPVAALEAGTDLLKPAQTRQLASSVDEGRLPIGVLNTAVTQVLTTMFAHHLVGRTPSGSPRTPVDSQAHTAFALVSAERSAVLLQNRRSVLPLSGVRARSVAVIGADASSPAVTTGFGSSQVTAPFISTPLRAIRHRAGQGATVSYSNGGSTTGALSPVPPAMLVPSSGAGHGITLTLFRTGTSTTTPTDPGSTPSPTASSISMVEPTVDCFLSPHPLNGRLLVPATARTELPKATVRHRRRHGPFFGPGLSRTRGRPSALHSSVALPAGWSGAVARWTGTLLPPRSGLYTFSLEGSGGGSLMLDGRTAVSDMLPHSSGIWSGSVPLVAHRPYHLELDWQPFTAAAGKGSGVTVPSQISLGWSYVSNQIEAAVAAARRASVAVVFAGDYGAEGFDRPSLSLPGDQNQLIDEIAAANPRTVVVLNTGGPVLMPWRDRVAGILEAWYPGEQDGAAIAALLFGDVDPSGRLPVTFPTSAARSAINTFAQWPGVDLSSSYSEGLDVGYRYDHAHRIRPLFPFGFGLSYTHFALGRLRVERTHAGATVTVVVTNKGTRIGTDVPQMYLTDPASADEPPAKLVAFSPVKLDPGHSRSVSLSVPPSAFETYLGGRWRTEPGRYRLQVGQSASDLALSASLTLR